MRRYYLIFILLLSVFYCNAAGSTEVFGLGFNSTDLRVADRTSYDLFNGSKKLYDGQITIDFEISILNPKRFGYVLNLYGKDDEFNIVLVNFRDKKCIWLDFNSIATHTKLSLPIPIAECHSNIWHKVSITFDKELNKIAYTLNDDKKEMAYDLTRFNVINSLFGLTHKYTDVASMAIRNITFCDGQTTYEFPLNENSGTTIYDSKHQAMGQVTNPNWKINAHHYWKNQLTLQQDKLCGLAYDSRRHNIIIYNADSILVISNQMNIQRMPNTFPNRFGIDSGGMIYDEQADCMVIYNPLPKVNDAYSLATYNYTDGTFNAEDLVIAESRLNHHNIVIDYQNNERNVWLFGGYGNHSYTNKFRRYDVSTHSWVEEAFTNNQIIEPRFFSAIGPTNNPSKYYLFGGFGNISGNQSDGADNYYDLYEVDFTHKTVKKLAKFNKPSKNFILTGNLIVSPDEQSFYALGYNHNEAHANGYMYYFDLKNKDFKRVSDSISIISEKIETMAYTWFDNYTHKIICAIHEYNPSTGVSINISTLDFPPVELPVKASISKDNRNIYFGFFSLFSILLLIIIGLFASRLLICHKKTAEVKNDLNKVKGDLPVQSMENNHANTIYLLGDFCVCAPSGKDISYRFSNKLRQLLILLLIYSDKIQNGISSAQISTILWPDKNDSNNIRRVTFKNLREALSDVNGIQIVFENQKWILKIDDKEQCDYLYIMSLSTEEIENKPYNAELISKVYDCCIRGTFLSPYSFSWLDSYKMQYEEHCNGVLMALLNKALSVNDYSSALKLTSCLLLIDSLNEDAFRIKIDLLIRTGRKQQANIKLHLFEEEYFKAYGKHLSMTDFLS